MAKKKRRAKAHKKVKRHRRTAKRKAKKGVKRTRRVRRAAKRVVKKVRRRVKRHVVKPVVKKVRRRRRKSLKRRVIKHSRITPTPRYHRNLTRKQSLQFRAKIAGAEFSITIWARPDGQVTNYNVRKVKGSPSRKITAADVMNAAAAQGHRVF